MKLVNLTPHALSIHRFPANEEELEGVVILPPSGSVARLQNSPPEQVGSVFPSILEAIPVFRMRTGDPEGLPDPQEGVFLVVSTMVRVACPDRDDLLSPGPLVRDEEGRPVGCEGLVCN